MPALESWCLERWALRGNHL